MKKKIKYFIPIAILLGFVFYFYLRTEVIIVQYDLATAHSYDDLVEHSGIIVKGQFVRFSNEWNMARDVNNNPSDTYETIGKVYDFKITDVYKGEVKDNSILKVNQAFSKTIDVSQFHDNTSQVKALEQLYIEPDLTKEYILFLEYNKEFDNYFGAIQPFMILVNNDQLQLESRLINTDGVFEKEYSIGLKRVIIQSRYNGIQDFSNELSLKQFEELFH